MAAPFSSRGGRGDHHDGGGDDADGLPAVPVRRASQNPRPDGGLRRYPAADRRLRPGKRQRLIPSNDRRPGVYYVEERRSEGEGEGWTVKPSGRFFSHVGRIAWNP